MSVGAETFTCLVSETSSNITVRSVFGQSYDAEFESEVPNGLSERNIISRHFFSDPCFKLDSTVLDS